MSWRRRRGCRSTKGDGLWADLTTSNTATLCRRQKNTECPAWNGEARCSHRIKKPLAPQRPIFWDRRRGVDVVLYLERYDFAISERFNIEVVYATVICG